MDWTKTLPTEPGYYWHRKYKWKFESIYYVFKKDKDDEVYCRWCHSGLYDLGTVEEVGGEWWGPLVAPSDQVN